MKKIGALINARLGSKRLPKKHLRDIGGKMALERLLERLMPCEDVAFIIATGAEKENNPLKDIAKAANIEIFFGDQNNIPNRHLQCAKHYNLDAVISIDADDILTSPRAFRDVLAALRNGKELVRTEGLPYGANILWAYTVAKLDYCVRNSKGIGSGDTGWGWIFDNDVIHRIGYSIKDADKIRLTMDYPEDLSLLRAIYSDCPLADFSDDTLLCQWLIANRAYRINKKYHLQSTN